MIARIRTFAGGHTDHEGEDISHQQTRQGTMAVLENGGSSSAATSVAGGSKRRVAYFYDCEDAHR
jgi:hypothetical protein